MLTPRSSVVKPKGDCIFLLHFDNHKDGVEWFWSVIAAGYTPAISTPFANDLGQRKKQILHLKALLKDPVILTTEKLAPEFLGLGGLHLEKIEAIQHRRANSSSTPDLSLLAGCLKNTETTAVLMLTSGSSGNAKAVCLRHGQLLRSVNGKSKHHETTKSDTFLNWIGLDHVANLAESHLHAMLLAAEQIHVHAADLLLDPGRFFTLISKHKVTHTFAPNFFLASLRATLGKPCVFKPSEEPACRNSES